ncbi:MAG: hypothetical protein Q8P56_06740 [Candidatus Uhrbacteria bacterium]|nr:hypothetical protein [Candidatus Uhrbacteria bacterium]
MLTIFDGETKTYVRQRRLLSMICVTRGEMSNSTTLDQKKSTPDVVTTKDSDPEDRWPHAVTVVYPQIGEVIIL